MTNSELSRVPRLAQYVVTFGWRTDSSNMPERWEEAIRVFEPILLLNPIYWLAVWFAHTQTLGDRTAVHLLFALMVAVAWFFASYFLAETAARQRGHMLIWLPIFFYFNVWAVGLWYM